MIIIIAAFMVVTSLAFAGDMKPLKTGPKDKCPVCGMFVTKYPDFAAQIQFRDGSTFHFDGAKDMFKFLHDLAKYAPGHRKEDIAGIYVTDFYNLERIDARKAIFVTGSDVLGPMGHELVPLASQADADDFLKEHKGRKILPFDRVSLDVPGSLDAGKF